MSLYVGVLCIIPNRASVFVAPPYYVRSCIGRVESHNLTETEITRNAVDPSSTNVISAHSNSILTLGSAPLARSLFTTCSVRCALISSLPPLLSSSIDIRDAKGSAPPKPSAASFFVAPRYGIAPCFIDERGLPPLLLILALGQSPCAARVHSEHRRPTGRHIVFAHTDPITGVRVGKFRTIDRHVGWRRRDGCVSDVYRRLRGRKKGE